MAKWKSNEDKKLFVKSTPEKSIKYNQCAICLKKMHPNAPSFLSLSLSLSLSRLLVGTFL